MINPAVGKGKALPNNKSREELILEHLPQVRLIANRIRNRIPPNISLDDLVSTGIVGLISAIDRYDSSHAVKLKTYAEYKIRGAILDSLRQLDWAPRQVRKRGRQIDLAITALERELRRVPTEDEIAEFLGISIVDLQSWQSETISLKVVSLKKTGSDEDAGDLLHYLSDSQERWPNQLFERSELAEQLTRACGEIPHLERAVLNLYFYEEMTLRDIAKILHLHESRISQLKTQAILKLKAYMAKQSSNLQGAVTDRSRRSLRDAACGRAQKLARAS